TTQTPQQRDVKPNWNGTTGVMWNEHPLRETLGRFAKMNNIGLMLDRRVDPGTPLSLDLKQVSVREVFEQAAAQVGCADGTGGLGFCELETVAYLGPPDAAELLQLLVALRSEQLAKLPKAKRDALLSPRPFHAELLDTPIETLKRLADEIGFDGTAFERLPHDVWPEIDFPNETPCTVFSLILIGFDCTLAVSSDATKLAAIPIPRELIVTREYKGPVARQLTEAELLTLAPDATVTPIPQGVSVKAPLAQVAKIETLIAKRTTAVNAEAIKQQNRQSTTQDALTRLQNERFSGNFTAALDKLLITFADRMQLELVIDEESFAAKNVRLDTRVSTSFEQATVTEVFEKCLAPIGAKFRIEGETVTVLME
ncbi:MAG: hypothetical protein FWD31_07180, partial [Planctomycetaceae bacterium]|nr:hypothetical protein [Planctomycetaceae bacterium]